MSQQEIEVRTLAAMSRRLGVKVEPLTDSERNAIATHELRLESEISKMKKSPDPLDASKDSKIDAGLRAEWMTDEASTEALLLRLSKQYEYSNQSHFLESASRELREAKETREALRRELALKVASMQVWVARSKLQEAAILEALKRIPNNSETQTILRKAIE